MVLLQFAVFAGISDGLSIYFGWVLLLGASAVEQVVAEYGLERTKYVLAAAIQTRDGDGRISRTNREWADSIRTIKDIDRRGFDRSCYYADLQAHTCLLDGFVNQVRKFEKAKAQPAQDTPER